MRLTIHAGHAAQGKRFSGAAGYCAESTVARQISKETSKWLRYAGHEVIDCTVDSGWSQGNIISQIKKKINAVKKADCNVSIHLNASSKSKADGKNKGCECLVYSLILKDSIVANRILKELKAIGFNSRGVKARPDLSILKGIYNGGHNVLVEVFFCDDEDDYNLYKSLGADVIGKAIAQGILGEPIEKKFSSNSYIHEGVDYSKVFNPTYYALKNKDVEKACGNSSTKLFEHFIKFGMKEGRQAIANFNVKIYKERYIDLQNKFQNSLPEYYKHFCMKGYYEGRRGI